MAPLAVRQQAVLEKSALRCVTVLTTHECNSRCVACGYWRQNDHARIDPSVVTRMVPWFKRHGVRRVCWSGGEPTLHPEFASLVKTTHAAGLCNTVLTNGSTFTHVYPEIRDYVDHFILSLDSPTERLFRKVRGSYSFEKLLLVPETIHHVSPHTTVTVSFLLHALNIDHVLDCVDLAGHIGADRIAFLALDYDSLDSPECRGEAFGWRTRTTNVIKRLRPTPAQVERFGHSLPTILEKIAEYPALQCGNNSLNRLLQYLRSFASGIRRTSMLATCPVAADHVLLTVEGDIRICWLSQESFRTDVAGDPLLQRAIRRARMRLLKDPAVQAGLCATCIQGQY